MTSRQTDAACAKALARAFRDSEDDPVSAAERCIALAEATPHCFIAVTRSRALAEAEASRERWRSGSPRCLIDGVPIAWKDMFDVSGTPTTMGSEIHRRGAPARRDAACVADASAAGLVCIGKTNLSEFAFSVLGLNPHFGTPSAPRSGETLRVPGGSSSGSAVAVAAGAALIGMATDTAGSARVPAAFNGLVGYRSTSSRYAKTGLAPLSPTLDSVGIIAWNVGDVATLDRILVGAHRERPTVEVLRPTLILDPSLLFDGRIAGSVRADILGCVEVLRRAGYPIRSYRIDVMHDVLGAIDRHGWLGAAEAYALHRDLLASPDAERMDQRVRRRLLDAADITRSDVATLRTVREEMMARSEAELGDTALLLPTVSHPPPPMSEMEADPARFAAVNLASLRLTAPASFLDLPAVTIPAGRGIDGLWSGLQLSMRRGQDECLLRVAAEVERTLGAPHVEAERKP